MKKPTRTLISVLLILSMLFSMQVLVSAEEAETTLPCYYSGTKVDDYVTEITTNYHSYSKTNPLVIDSADKLVAFAKVSAVNDLTFSEKKIILTTDIVLNQGDAEEWAANTRAFSLFSWIPIGGDNTWQTTNEGKGFAGIFDGQGHTISGLYLKGNYYHAGLFGFLGANAEIANVGLVNSYIESTRVNASQSPYIGGIAGRINGTGVTISNCYTDAIVVSTYACGGIVGLVTNSSTADNASMAVISDCVFEGSVKATYGTIGTTNYSAYCGGIVGMMGTVSGNHDAKIQNCVNFGTVEKTFDGSAAAIVGYNYAEVTLVDCLNYGVITPSGTGNYTNSNALIGQMKNDTAVSCTVTNSYIFTDLNQNLFVMPAQWNCGNCKYNVNNVTAIADIKTSTENYTIVNSMTTKGAAAETTLTAFDFEGDDAKWVTREGDYPMPKTVYDNFFKIEMKYVQSNKSGEALDVRLIAEISSLNYANVGFNVTVTVGDTSKNASLTTTKVYKTINDTTYGNVEATDGRCFVALAITNLPVAGEVTIKVTPIAGAEIGTTYTVVYTDGVCTSVSK